MLSMLAKWVNDGEICYIPDIPRDSQTPEPRKATSLPCNPCAADAKDAKDRSPRRVGSRMPKDVQSFPSRLACCQLGSSFEPSKAQGSLIFELTSVEPSAGKPILEMLCSAQTAA